MLRLLPKQLDDKRMVGKKNHYSPPSRFRKVDEVQVNHAVTELFEYNDFDLYEY